jgi:outer membrane protein OmpA-like peptidoglycan-associated protein
MAGRSIRWLVFAAATAIAAASSAEEKVFKGPEVSESALIDALEIEAPATSQAGSTRGFRSVAPTGRVVKPGGGKASLLITFATDSADLTSDARTALDTVARAFDSDRLAAFSFRIEGHADPRGGEEYNRRLSQARAETVVKYLISKHHVLPERLTAVGKGSSELLDTQRPDAPENRRVTIVTKAN